MIGYIKIDKNPGAQVRKVRIRILDADDNTRVRFEIQMTRAVWKRAFTGDIWQACEYTVFDRPEKTRDREEGE